MGEEKLVSLETPLKSSKKPKLLFVPLGLMILVLVGEGVYFLKLKKEKKSLIKEASQQAETEVFLSEEQLSAAIVRLFPDEKSQSAQSVLESLEEAKNYDPKKFPENMAQYACYTSIGSTLVGEYYASSGSRKTQPGNT